MRSPENRETQQLQFWGKEAALGYVTSRNEQRVSKDWNNITRILSWNNLTFVEGNTLENRYFMFGLKLLTRVEKVSQNNLITGRSFLGYILIRNNQYMLLHVLY